MKKILITGANGFLGQHLVRSFSNTADKVIATGRGLCRVGLSDAAEYVAAELTDQKEINVLLRHHKPDVIIHNAALSRPNDCDVNRNKCRLVNVESTKLLLAYEAEQFIYLSSDFVFGENGPHAEDAETGPLNFYGETKLLAETLVQESSKKSTIVRPSFIYGQTFSGMKPGFMQWVKANLEQRKQIKVVSDQLRTPTYVYDICRGIQSIISQKATGIYHLAGKDILSPYEMAIQTANVLDLDALLIEKVTAETFEEPVKRAKKAGLLIDKAKSDLAYNPTSFDEGIRLTFTKGKQIC